MVSGNERGRGGKVASGGSGGRDRMLESESESDRKCDGTMVYSSRCCGSGGGCGHAGDSYARQPFLAICGDRAFNSAFAVRLSSVDAFVDFFRDVLRRVRGMLGFEGPAAATPTSAYTLALDIVRSRPDEREYARERTGSVRPTRSFSKLVTRTVSLLSSTCDALR